MKAIRFTSVGSNTNVCYTSFPIAILKKMYEMRNNTFFSSDHLFLPTPITPKIILSKIISNLLL